jgi:tRNA(Ile)-lysidine synthase
VTAPDTGALFPDPPRLFARYRLAEQACIISAVSGGSDSTALLLLLKAHLDAAVPAARLLAVTVDHGLRAGSDAEADQVGALCEKQGIEHLTLRWEGQKPGRGISAAAREARYRLLADAARENDAELIFVGHTLDDQVETVAMRAERGDGRGLAGIAPATLYESRFWVVRPLLECRRVALRDFLDRSGTRWIDDPSNSNEAFERVRVRAELRSGERLAELRARATEAALARKRDGEAAASLIRDHARMVSPGLFFLAAELAVQDRDAGTYALRMLLAAIGGVEQLPDAERVSRLLDRLGRGGRATLSRVAVEFRREGAYLRRELRGLPEIADLEDALWDGRFRIGGGSDAMVKAIGRENAAALFDDTTEVPRGLAVAALAAEPGLWREDEFLGPLFPDAGTVTASRLVTPFARFLPSFDLAPAGALGELFTLPPLPAPPWQSHIDADA